jgi:hypothetical protein
MWWSKERPDPPVPTLTGMPIDKQQDGKEACSMDIIPKHPARGAADERGGNSATQLGVQLPARGIQHGGHVGAPLEPMRNRP